MPPHTRYHLDLLDDIQNGRDPDRCIRLLTVVYEHIKSQRKIFEPEELIVMLNEIIDVLDEATATFPAYKNQFNLFHKLLDDFFTRWLTETVED